MLHISQFRRVYPKHNDLPDYDLTWALHHTTAPDAPFGEFTSQFGGPMLLHPNTSGMSNRFSCLETGLKRITPSFFLHYGQEKEKLVTLRRTD
jgi:hypothetical protein